MDCEANNKVGAGGGTAGRGWLGGLPVPSPPCPCCPGERAHPVPVPLLEFGQPLTPLTGTKPWELPPGPQTHPQGGC